MEGLGQQDPHLITLHKAPYRSRLAPRGPKAKIPKAEHKQRLDKTLTSSKASDSSYFSPHLPAGILGKTLGLCELPQLARLPQSCPQSGGCLASPLSLYLGPVASPQAVWLPRDNLGGPPRQPDGQTSSETGKEVAGPGFLQARLISSLKRAQSVRGRARIDNRRSLLSHAGVMPSEAASSFVILKFHQKNISLAFSITLSTFPLLSCGDLHAQVNWS